MLTPGPRYRTLRASGCTSRWVFGPSGSTIGWAINSTRGTMWGAGVRGVGCHFGERTIVPAKWSQEPLPAADPEPIGPGRIESGAVTGEKGKAAAFTELSLVLAAVFWGSNYAATRYAAGHLPELLIVAFRFAVGGLLLLLVLRLLEPESRLGKNDVLPMLGLGCLGVAVSQTTFTFGVSLTSTANTGLVFATAPVWGLLLGF